MLAPSLPRARGRLEVRDDGSLRITDPYGQVLGAPPGLAVDPSAPDLAAQNTARGVHIDHTTAIPHWYGDSIDLDRVVTWLLWSADHHYACFGTLPADETLGCANPPVCQ